MSMFESSVNSEGIETTFSVCLSLFEFESSVNSEGIETFNTARTRYDGLRAV